MSLEALLYAYILGGLTFFPLLICAAVAWTIYTSVPVVPQDFNEPKRSLCSSTDTIDAAEKDSLSPSFSDGPRPRKGWLTVRRTFEEKESEGSYVNMMRSFLDAHSKDPKKSRPKDMWFVVLKSNVLYLYEDDAMTECEAVIHLSSHKIVIYPEGLADGELFTKRNAICLKPIDEDFDGGSASSAIDISIENDADKKSEERHIKETCKRKAKRRTEDTDRSRKGSEREIVDSMAPWFIFIRTCVDMEDWYHALVHAANYSPHASPLEQLHPVFRPPDMDQLVSTLDELPDEIPMRWLNALLGRIFYSFYRTRSLESFIIGKLMKKLSKVKTPSFLQNVSVSEVSVGTTSPTFSKPMLKELTKEGDAALEVRVMYRGEVRLTVEATAVFSLGQRFKTYFVKLVLAVVLRKLDGNLLIKMKRPPSNRIWYSFTHAPDMVLDVEPVVSERQIKWSVICSTIESRLKEIINESIVLPNMDDIAFFDSTPYRHRGGIWPDAKRDELMPKDVESELADLGIVPELPTIEKSHPDDILLGSTSHSSSLGNSSIEASSSGADEEVKPRIHELLGHEFGINDLSPTIGLNLRQDRFTPPENERGRSPLDEPNMRRATSVPPNKAVPHTDNEINADERSENSFRSDSAIGTISKADELFRSSSSNLSSSSSSHTQFRSLSSGDTIQEPDLSSATIVSRVQQPNATSNTSSFLASFKPKIEKQSLSSTAKEAVRKWSANWSGFKRDHLSHSSSAQKLADGDPHGSSSLFGFSAKGRSYTDVRASSIAKEERKRASFENHVKNDEILDNPETSAIDENVGGTHQTHSSPEKHDQSVTQSPRRDIHESTPRSPAIIAVDNNSLTIRQPVQQFAQAEEQIITAMPIKTQPSQGATMTIPGIHASHRGEVMSYGSSPLAHASNIPSESQPSSTVMSPAIQSVYKLFKNPSPTNSAKEYQQQQQWLTAPPNSVPDSNHKVEDVAAGNQVAPLSNVVLKIKEQENVDTATTISQEFRDESSSSPVLSSQAPRHVADQDDIMNREYGYYSTSSLHDTQSKLDRTKLSVLGAHTTATTSEFLECGTAQQSNENGVEGSSSLVRQEDIIEDLKTISIRSNAIDNTTNEDASQIIGAWTDTKLKAPPLPPRPQSG